MSKPDAMRREHVIFQNLKTPSPGVEVQSFPLAPMIRVLFCSDVHDERLSGLLGGAHHVDWEGSYDFAKTALERDEHDVYLIDALFGSGRGAGLAQAIARRGARPVIVLVRRPDATFEAKTLARGVADVLVVGELSAANRSTERCGTPSRARLASVVSNERIRRRRRWARRRSSIGSRTPSLGREAASAARASWRFAGINVGRAPTRAWTQASSRCSKGSPSNGSAPACATSKR